MTKAGLLESQRGPSDGVRLAQAPEAISLMDIVQAINGEALFTECILGLPGCGEQQPGPIHDTRAAERARIATTLAYAHAYRVHERRPAGRRDLGAATSIRGFTGRFRNASFPRLAGTSTCRLHTGVLVLPPRPPYCPTAYSTLSDAPTYSTPSSPRAGEERMAARARNVHRSSPAAVRA